MVNVLELNQQKVDDFSVFGMPIGGGGEHATEGRDGKVWRETSEICHRLLEHGWGVMFSSHSPPNHHYRDK